ncbi:MAG: ATP-binding cassette domain-containing protein [Planctomycetota bacterium]
MTTTATQPAAPSPAESPPPLVRVKGLHKRFGDREVLRGVDLEIPTGRTTIVLGPSGCGKSVMLKHIVGLMRPDAGEIWFGGARLDTLSERELAEHRRRIGFLFQLSALFDSMTVAENLGFPVREHNTIRAADRPGRIAEVLEMVDMGGSQDMLPAELSGGQKKRVALARALMLEPELILYDEPTTGLDPERAKDIDGLVVRLNERLGVTGLVVTHDLISARRTGDRIIMLDRGVVIAQGTFEDLVGSEQPRVRRFLAAAGVAGSAGGRM